MGRSDGRDFLSERFTGRKMLGMLCGVVGVGFLVRLGPVAFTGDLLLGVLACVGATICYALAGIYSKSIRRDEFHADGDRLQIGAAFVLLPFLPLVPVQGEITSQILLLGAALALLCSAVPI
jgi:drug/metabolite transporter (DMT)-like permease